MQQYDLNWGPNPFVESAWILAWPGLALSGPQCFPRKGVCAGVTAGVASVGPLQSRPRVDSRASASGVALGCGLRCVLLVSPILTRVAAPLPLIFPQDVHSLQQTDQEQQGVCAAVLLQPGAGERAGPDGVEKHGI